MVRRYILSLLLLSSLILPLQANQADIQEQILQIELAERARLGIVDDVISFAAGCGGAVVAGITTACLSRLVTHDCFKNYMAILGGFAWYGMLSAKLANDEGQKKKMFGRGGIVGATGLLLMCIPGAYEVYLETYYGSRW